MTQVQTIEHTASVYDQVGKVRVVSDAARKPVEQTGRLAEPIEGRPDIGCLSHFHHEISGSEVMLNARRRVDFYSRWHGMKEPLLQIWKAS
ncbi:hypothetical protein [Salinicola avicenniae]|uniref:hypothetical protein n=1 Tax=Salinicola avicenniae TaxID=2916836 RepID=UPI002074612C|nr:MULTISPECIES: hypothetical protein [unclassified Salinicola]